MAHDDKGHFETEDRGAILIVRVDGGPHALFGPEVANQLEELVDRVDHDSSVHAVVFTGAHSERFISHADVRWLQEGARPLLRSGDTALPQSYARPKSVDELVPQDKVVSRAAERAEYFGLRPKGAIAAIRRSVYFGGSMSLSEGLHVERTEFFIADQSKDAQDLMLDYLATTEATGELPLYNRDTYARALKSGRMSSRSSNGRRANEVRALISRGKPKEFHEGRTDRPLRE